MTIKVSQYMYPYNYKGLYGIHVQPHLGSPQSVCTYACMMYIQEEAN